MASFTLALATKYELTVVGTKIFSVYEARAVRPAAAPAKAAAGASPVVQQRAQSASPARSLPKPEAARAVSPMVLDAPGPSSPAVAPAPAAAAAAAKPATRLPTTLGSSNSPPAASAKVTAAPAVEAKRVASPVSTASPPSPAKTEPKVPASPHVAPASPPAAPASPPAAASSSPPASSEAAKATKHEGLSIPYEITDLYNDIKLKKKARFAIYKIVDMAVVVDKVSPRNSTLDDFIGTLKEAECCFAVYDHDGAREDQYGKRIQPKIFFVLWTPVAAPIVQKMQYSSEARTLGSLLHGNNEIRATKKDDILIGVGQKSKLAEESDDDAADKHDDSWMDD